MAAKKARKVGKKHARKAKQAKAKAKAIVEKKAKAKSKKTKTTIGRRGDVGIAVIAFVRNAISANPSITTAKLHPQALKAYPDSATVQNGFPVLMARARRQLVDSGKFKDSDFIEAKGGRGIGAKPKPAKKVVSKKKVAKKAKKKAKRKKK